jgi:hypothetical protein
MSTTVDIHEAKTHLPQLAQREGLPIITADPAIAQYDVEVAW